MHSFIICFKKMKIKKKIYILIISFISELARKQGSMIEIKEYMINN